MTTLDLIWGAVPIPCVVSFAVLGVFQVPGLQKSSLLAFLEVGMLPAEDELLRQLDGKPVGSEAFQMVRCRALYAL